MTPTPLTHPSRRQLLHGGAAVGLALLATGCATPIGSAKARVVVVGGGWGGIGAARTLAESGQVDVTMLEPNPSFMSCPMSALYIAGLKPLSYLNHSYRNVDRTGVRRVRERATAIDRAARFVQTETQRLPYDYLVLAPGVEYMEDSLPGFAEGRDRLPVGFRAFEHEAVRQQVDAFLSQGGIYVMTVPRPPFRCPPAPYERACLIAEQMRKRGTKGKIIIVDANPDPTPAPTARPVRHAMETLYPNEIEYRVDMVPTRIDAARRVLSTPEGDINYTAANIIPPMRAPALIRQAGLGERWASVHLPSFRTTADPLVYVIGDSQGTLLPKSGHVAFGAGQQVAKEIVGLVTGRPDPAPAPGTTVALPGGICWAKVSERTAIMVNVSASMQIGEAARLRFEVDPQHNEPSKKASIVWADAMWGSMFG
ncbi:NAD(P)/FAD-dependent oxidoreductase [Serpentinimonas maccroryi]|uniref:NAD(P)/FAD-dependent oxidoreductase n=1 Tax=Serpentinimonas maccroryi TaxID=1458426 RepID=UPI0020346EE9|nr:FAD/NAD(P)-binding oxidoreductase [Serpentinimonas maccroryi]MCM2478793.1 NAD(P)/FAD-dependent oxidoreductase [Serpentinimonas maccroryi]